MDEDEKANLVMAAIALGFKVKDHDELTCTHEQLCQLCAIIAATTIEQIEAEDIK
jgi:hypothetical protein